MISWTFSIPSILNLKANLQKISTRMPMTMGTKLLPSETKAVGINAFGAFQDANHCPVLTVRISRAIWFYRFGTTHPLPVLF